MRIYDLVRQGDKNDSTIVLVLGKISTAKRGRYYIYYTLVDNEGYYINVIDCRRRTQGTATVCGRCYACMHLLFDTG